MEIIKLNDAQLESCIDLAGGEPAKYEFEVTNLTGLIAVTVFVGRTKRTYLMDKTGSHHELVKKERKEG